MTESALRAGYLLSYLGRHDESIAVGERARRLDPENPFAGGLSFKLGMAGRYDEARVSWHRVVQWSPTVPIFREWLAFTEIAHGNDAEALNQLRIAESLLGDDRPIIVLPHLTWAYGRLGRTDDARRLFDEIAASAAAGSPIGTGGWAAAYLGIGDRERALEQLTLAAEQAARHQPDAGFFTSLNLKVNPTNDPVLRQPEFVAVLDRIRGD